MLPGGVDLGEFGAYGLDLVVQVGESFGFSGPCGSHSEVCPGKSVVGAHRLGKMGVMIVMRFDVSGRGMGSAVNAAFRVSGPGGQNEASAAPVGHEW